MTRGRDHAEGELIRQARREADRTGQDVCAVLRAWRLEAARTRDKAREQEIVTAEKFLRCRNKRKR